jgi:hypothetical protein
VKQIPAAFQFETTEYSVWDFDWDRQQVLYSTSSGFFLRHGSNDRKVPIDLPEGVRIDDLLLVQFSSRANELVLTCRGRHNEFHPGVPFDDSYLLSSDNTKTPQFLGSYLPIGPEYALKGSDMRYGQIGVAAPTSTEFKWSRMASTFEYAGLIVTGESVALVRRLPDPTESGLFQLIQAPRSGRVVLSDPLCMPPKQEVEYSVR